MREIKFRAWSPEKHELIYFEPSEVCDIESDLAIYSGMVNKDLDNYSELTYPDRIGFPYPLMQYTGLEDNLGVEVYEGDIVAIYPLEQANHATVEQILFGWCFKQADGAQTTYLSPELFKVIGNIYEGVKE